LETQAESESVAAHSFVSLSFFYFFQDDLQELLQEEGFQPSAGDMDPIRERSSRPPGMKKTTKSRMMAESSRPCRA